MVSVIIPNYNHSLYLKTRIDSILNQTFQDFELIILDDLSTDNSREIIEDYRNHNKVTSIHFNERNSGSTFKQWNKAVSLAKYDIIWIAESDDTADERFLETLYPMISTNKAIGIAYCQSLRMDGNGCVTGSWLDWTDALDSEKFKLDFTMTGTTFVEYFLIHKNVIPNASGVLFRKDVFLKTGGADEHIKNCSDWLLWIKMLMLSDVAFSAKDLNYFRHHQRSVIASAASRISKELYFEWSDRSTRINYLLPFLKKQVVSNIEAISKINQFYISKDNAENGFFEIEHGRWLNGIKLVIKASIAQKSKRYLWSALRALCLNLKLIKKG